ncbi:MULTISPECIES: 4-aminobutyrate--2-oxoglutarate transaminase [unclassified Meiothermus]|uniref:4-aminobutyrate--2-oxoglutarate transaminase n=1 Tax=unclassified Meiothermus TaxID=370471 RepID=UPI000D7CD5C1|nr:MULTISPECIES: 4-aminobutyrate--2-oxoglutarate transaminase [unclassified Meiothermus]PZA07869.1 4-aminobutyrate--2-oxoglutarate transaminase [Meiothermus sp. Pnk-1]RYM38826.1 4-aminobutyrate--2-oxoglutarate transaminase [Meiothermus sp. PNK-Is4]
MPTTESRNQALLELRQKVVPRGVSQVHPVVAERALGGKIWDVDGREYLDWIGGIGVLNVGHNHPRVVAAVKAQLERFSHTCFQVTAYEGYIRLAEKLCQSAPGDAEKKAFFVTTGAEATENAIKIARAYTGRPAVIAFRHSFHGRTLMGLTLTGKSQPYRQNFGPFAPEVYHAPYPYEYRGVDTQTALEALQELFDTEVSPERVAALIIEPQLGEGGFVPAPAAFLRSLRALTQQHGIVLIDDEIQSGIGRTGKFWAIEHAGVEPDLITFAKSIGGGLPIAGVLGKAEIMDAPLPGGLGGTFAGNPLACAAGLAVLEVFEEEQLLERGQRLGEILHEGFGKLQRRFPQIGDVRGLGPMVAMELVKDRQSKAPDPALTTRVFDAARERGLLLMKAGMYSNVIRCLVPLVVSEAEVRKGLEILEHSLEAATA